MKLPTTVTAEEIRALFKKLLGISLQQSSLYHYRYKHGFPPNSGLSRPRRWNRAEVMKWFKEHERKSRAAAK